MGPVNDVNSSEKSSISDKITKLPGKTKKDRSVLEDYDEGAIHVLPDDTSYTRDVKTPLDSIKGKRVSNSVIVNRFKDGVKVGLSKFKFKSQEERAHSLILEVEKAHNVAYKAFLGMYEVIGEDKEVKVAAAKKLKRALKSLKNADAKLERFYNGKHAQVSNTTLSKISQIIHPKNLNLNKEPYSDLGQMLMEKFKLNKRIVKNILDHFEFNQLERS